MCDAVKIRRMATQINKSCLSSDLGGSQLPQCVAGFRLHGQQPEADVLLSVAVHWVWLV